MSSSGEDDEICLNIHLGIKQNGNAGPQLDDKIFDELLEEWRPPPIPVEELKKRCGYREPLEEIKANSKDNSKPSASMKNPNQKENRKRTDRTPLIKVNRNSESKRVDNKKCRPSSSTGKQEQIKENYHYRHPSVETNESSQYTQIEKENTGASSLTEEHEQIKENYQYRNPNVITNKSSQCIQIEKQNTGASSSTIEQEEIRESYICCCIIS